VGLTKGGGSRRGGSAPLELPSSERGPVEARVTNRGLQDEIVLEVVRIRKEPRDGGGSASAETTGFLLNVDCKPIACLGSDTVCATTEVLVSSGEEPRYYEPGCCLDGEECATGTRCGMLFPCGLGDEEDDLTTLFWFFQLLKASCVLPACAIV